MIYIGADHAGYNLKEQIKEWLTSQDLKFEDIGAEELNPTDDYPDFAKAVADKVTKNPEAKGILACGTAEGMCIAANKEKGIRAIIGYDEFVTRASREHNNANVICFGGRSQDPEEVKKLLKIWFETQYSGEERHDRRLAKIEDLE
ncbi:MAG: ribose-5-phosphate isomerase [Candidatus Portnoybacteria bacterium CG10_big_fil_rev_8_21_14_0_10_36_7]|uniref:Ribose-5-phosphate isomerase n=1 Tax=Candidatus Portnoybacteria bacterium CG10_big_fil_rev_8_21_14_0_10_36_7 TaxID=1974812 RepID=A0A2M8KET4_9BACT|nr:MAG: ribose-5-phosphate isomerase [Candidatus Portnoybacteria bacterium CG10_big_fil_rev_8_21_14_0_10_36_7]